MYVCLSASVNKYECEPVEMDGLSGALRRADVSDRGRVAGQLLHLRERHRGLRGQLSQVLRGMRHLIQDIRYQLRSKLQEVTFILTYMHTYMHT